MSCEAMSEVIQPEAREIGGSKDQPEDFGDCRWAKWCVGVRGKHPSAGLASGKQRLCLCFGLNLEQSLVQASRDVHYAELLGLGGANVTLGHGTLNCQRPSVRVEIPPP